MLSYNNKNKYKVCEFKPNYNKQNHYYTKLTFNKPDLKKIPLLDHYSVIGQKTQKEILEMYPEYVITRVLKPYELDHKRDKKDIQNILKPKTNNKNELEYYESDINIIKDKFLTYMYNISKNKFLLVGRNDENKPVIWEGLNRYQSNRNINKYSNELSILENSHIPVSMLTLTYDHDKRSLIEAWKNISKDLHAFRKKLFYTLGYHIPYLWVIEAQKNGYPHIHMLFFGVNYIYYNGTFEDYQKRKKGELTDKSIQSMWNLGFTSVNTTKKGDEIKNPVSYVMKYVRKTWSEWNDEAILTKSLLWTFNKRSFNVSRDFSKYCLSLKKPDKPIIEMIYNPVDLENTVILSKNHYIPKPKKPDNPYMPLTFLVKHNLENNDYGLYECSICYDHVDVKNIDNHLKTHGLADHSLMYVIDIQGHKSKKFTKSKFDLDLKEEIDT